MSVKAYEYSRPICFGDMGAKQRKGGNAPQGARRDEHDGAVAPTGLDKVRLCLLFSG